MRWGRVDVDFVECENGTEKDKAGDDAAEPAGVGGCDPDAEHDAADDGADTADMPMTSEPMVKPMSIPVKMPPMNASMGSSLCRATRRRSWW